MKKKCEYSIELRGRIQILSEEGYTHEITARRLKIPKLSVQYMLARFKNKGTNATRKHCRRPKCISESEDKHIIVISKRIADYQQQ